MQINSVRSAVRQSPPVNQRPLIHKAVNRNTNATAFKEFLRRSISYGLLHPAHTLVQLGPVHLHRQRIMDPQSTETSMDDRGESEDVELPYPQPHHHGLPSNQPSCNPENHTFIDTLTAEQHRNFSGSFNLFSNTVSSTCCGWHVSSSISDADTGRFGSTVSPRDIVSLPTTLESETEIVYPIAPNFYNYVDPNHSRWTRPDHVSNSYVMSQDAAWLAPSDLTNSPSTTPASSNETDDSLFGYSFSNTLHQSTAASSFTDEDDLATSASLLMGNRPVRPWYSVPNAGPARSNQSIPSNAEAYIPATGPQLLAMANFSDSSYNRIPDEADGGPQNRIAPANEGSSQASSADAGSRAADDGEGTSSSDDADEPEQPNIRRKHETESAFRQRRDKYLVDMRRRGFPYRIIKAKGRFTEAESTLRGRVRTLTKDKSARVRHPTWTAIDIHLLRERVQVHLDADSRDDDAWSDSQRSIKVPWSKVAEWIEKNGGTYRFAAATCSKKWAELNR